MSETLLESRLFWTEKGISHKMKGQHQANGLCHPSHAQAEAKEFLHQPFRGASLKQPDLLNHWTIESCSNFTIKFFPKRQPFTTPIAFLGWGLLLSSCLRYRRIRAQKAGGYSLGGRWLSKDSQSYIKGNKQLQFFSAHLHKCIQKTVNCGGHQYHNISAPPSCLYIFSRGEFGFYAFCDRSCQGIVSIYHMKCSIFWSACG